MLIEKIVPDTDQITHLRKEKGFWSAKQQALKEALLSAVDNASTLDDLKKILRTIIDP